MAQLAEIKDRIRVISNLRKVTRAMELVTRTKINRVRQNAVNARQYHELSRAFFSTVAGAGRSPRAGAYGREAPHGEPGQTRHVVAFFSHKGFCGGFNEKLLRKLAAFAEQNLTGPGRMMVTLVGRRAGKGSFPAGVQLRSLAASGKNYMADFEPLLAELGELVRLGAELHVDFAYNRLISILDQQPVIETVYPFEPAAGETRAAPGGVLLDPGPDELQRDMTGLYLRATVEKTYWESLAGEYCARLLAMKNANENASLLIDSLQLQYNKTRQARITQELAEIVSAFDILRGGAAKHRKIETR